MFFVLPVYSLHFVFYIFVSYMSLPGDDDLSSLLATFLSVFLRFVLLFPDSDCVPSLIWFGSVNLVTTARIVAYQLVRDKLLLLWARLIDIPEYCIFLLW